MKGITDASYGEAIADLYDDMHPIPAEDAVAMLSELATLDGGAKGGLLELGIGTGRLALPLAARGFDVVGIDASRAMVAQLRAKPGGERIRVAFGNFGETIAGDNFATAFVAFNTFFALTSQAAQKQCFANVARQLGPGGTFVVEAFVPDIARFESGQSLRTGRLTVDGVVLEATRHDRATQTLDTQLVVMTEKGTRLVPIVLRYAFPAELDLMAELAGMSLRDRFGSFARTPFTSQAMQHVSIYEKR